MHSCTGLAAASAAFSGCGAGVCLRKAWPGPASGCYSPLPERRPDFFVWGGLKRSCNYSALVKILHDHVRSLRLVLDFPKGPSNSNFRSRNREAVGNDNSALSLSLSQERERERERELICITQLNIMERGRDDDEHQAWAEPTILINKRATRESVEPPVLQAFHRRCI